MEIAILRQALCGFTGMSEAEFDLSKNYWTVKEYEKGTFYNEYKNVCKHLGFIISGVFRTYHVHESSGEEKNMLFFTERQFVCAFKSFLTQRPCNYYTESLVRSTILYIHIDDLNRLYETSHAWEKFGRLMAEMAFNLLMDHTEDFLFKSPEERYLSMVELHPVIFNTVPLYHIASYLGIHGPSLSRIRKRLAGK